MIFRSIFIESFYFSNDFWYRKTDSLKTFRQFWKLLVFLFILNLLLANIQVLIPAQNPALKWKEIGEFLAKKFRTKESMND